MDRCKPQPLNMGPAPMKAGFARSFLSSVGNPGEAVQENFSKQLGIGYFNGVGEVIYEMVTA